MLLSLSLLAALLGAAPPPPPQEFHVTWLGHAGFEVVSPGGTRLLIDPWLKENPRAPEAWKDLTRLARTPPAAILLTHSHGDHAQDVHTLARLSGAPVVGTGETLRWLKVPEAQQLTVNVGGSTRIGDVTIHAVPAMHSCEPDGRPLGYVLVLPGGRSLYHTGDTWLFGDMALVQELLHPDIVLLNVGGGRYGMDPRTAALAVRKYFRPSIIVPMHFGTFEPLATEAQAREALGSDTRVRWLTPGIAASL
ncbi:metal-dependent hydrolase [Corallococcus exercitus]|uniref:Metal-dependent hydrolase n=1 Tax=Corallococcus exercitus TaxID=2316736 RepID=A0A7Y4NVR3_9BACT|nr:metal-dependent hydrolase [Corallococcus exercitus]NOK37357.1 metal-dependent hydrolase [Corallococcus exercitus]